MKILKLLAVFASLVLAPFALAADVAEIDIWGFSRDGKTFAFEQFGVADGSGVAYSRVTIIDLASDTLAAPVIENRTDPDGASLLPLVRGQSRDDAEDLGFLRFNFSFNLSMLAAWTPQRQVETSDARRLSFVPQNLPRRSMANFTDSVLNLELVEETVALPRCDQFEMGSSARIAKIELTRADMLRPIWQYNDQPGEPPLSRGCPVAYQLAGIVVTDHASVILIRYAQMGFEGTNDRYIAISAGKLELS